MTAQFVSLASVVRDHVEAYQRLTWFAIESLEREHLITLRAFWATLGVMVPDVRSRRPADRPAPHVARGVDRRPEGDRGREPAFERGTSRDGT